MIPDTKEEIIAMPPFVLSPRQIASWSLSALRPACPQYPIAGIPSLQRGLVWNAAKIELLWDSMLRGFPIGSFVVCRRLTQQATREENERDLSEAKYHLLDGQQRAHGIALGFEDPFAISEKHTRSILWLDLKCANPSGTRTFLFRLTTEAHPWGYTADDSASRLGIAKIRASLELSGFATGGKEDRDRPLPIECWPIDAEVPVPLSWLIARKSSDPGAFWSEIRNRCEQQAEAPWIKAIVSHLSDVSQGNVEHLSEIYRALRRALATGIVCLELPEDAVRSRSAQEANNVRAGEQNISNVEHLFHRLNAGGVRLEGDELSYSMIKAYWPEVEDPIRRIANRRMPEARLVTLAVRLALAATREASDGGPGQRNPPPITVSDIRRLAQDEARSEQRSKVLDFLISNKQPNLASVINIIEGWLGHTGAAGDDIGLPPVLKTSIARGSPEVYLLLMWLAQRVIQGSDWATVPHVPTLLLRKRVLGLTTALHWFGHEKARAARVIADELDARWDGVVSPSIFQGILSKAYDVERRVGVFRPLSPEELEDLIVLPDEKTFDAWRWYLLVNQDDQARLIWGFLDRIRQEHPSTVGKELLLYAQRDYLKRRFGSYDPARTDLWEQHDRPWDFDHILPAAMTYYRQDIPSKDALNEWIYSVANLRACPMADNRSDQKIAPSEKLKTETSRANSFVEESERLGFQRGYEDVSEFQAVIGFVRSARSRLLRIYRQWYDTLDIAFLTDGSNLGDSDTHIG